jgi:hypothetical protein
MNPSPDDVFKLISSHELGRALRGEDCAFITPADINDDMRPTDHSELLASGIYPLTIQHGPNRIRLELEGALHEISYDALGVFCAIQCFYLQVVKEDAKVSPINVDRKKLAEFLADCFLKHAQSLHHLALGQNDLALDRTYRLTLSRMRILARDHGVSWGMELPSL